MRESKFSRNRGRLVAEEKPLIKEVSYARIRVEEGRLSHGSFRRLQVPFKWSSISDTCTTCLPFLLLFIFPQIQSLLHESQDSVLESASRASNCLTIHDLRPTSGIPRECLGRGVEGPSDIDIQTARINYTSSLDRHATHGCTYRRVESQSCICISSHATASLRLEGKSHMRVSCHSLTPIE